MGRQWRNDEQGEGVGQKNLNQSSVSHCASLLFGIIQCFCLDGRREDIDLAPLDIHIAARREALFRFDVGSVPGLEFRTVLGHDIGDQSGQGEGPNKEDDSVQQPEGLFTGQLGKDGFSYDFAEQ